MKRFQTLAATLGIGAGAYLGSVGYQVYSSQAEEGLILQQLTDERAASCTAEASVHRDEAAIEALQAQMELHHKGMERIDGEIEQAQQRLEDLQRQRAGLEREQQEAAGAVEEARSRMVRWQKELRQHQENLGLAQQALVAARSHTEEAKLLFNPLNHPLVKDHLGGKGGPF